MVALNVGKRWRVVNISKRFGLPEKLRVVVSSIQSQYNEGFVPNEISEGNSSTFVLFLYREIVNATNLAIPNDVGLVLSLCN